MRVERNAGIIDLGDMIDGMQGRTDRRGHKSALLPELCEDDYLDRLVDYAERFFGAVTKGVISSNRMAVYAPDASVIVTGNSHDEWSMTIARDHISATGVRYRDEQTHVRTPGYKDEWTQGNGWAVERGNGPKPQGAAWLRVYWERVGNSRVLRHEVTRAK